MPVEAKLRQREHHTSQFVVNVFYINIKLLPVKQVTSCRLKNTYIPILSTFTIPCVLNTANFTLLINFNFFSIRKMCMVGKSNAFRVRFHAVVSFCTTTYIIGLVWRLSVSCPPLINPGNKCRPRLASLNPASVPRKCSRVHLGVTKLFCKSADSWVSILFYYK